MAARTPLLVGNWKMYRTASEAATLVDALKEHIADVADRDVLIAPPFPALPAVAERLRGTRFLLGAQNMHWQEHGAFTGEVSAPMLTDLGCSHVIVGHSERRQHFGETDDWVSRKVQAALYHRLTPILCVGETPEQHQAGQALAVVGRQVRTALREMGAAAISRIVVAYEPVWAIGTGKVATPEQAQNAHAAIRQLLGELAAEAVAAQCRILYGGSVKPDNINALMSQPDLDGALVGGASLDADAFARIVRFC